MATLADLRQANANIEQQMTAWKQHRFANGENPMDWVAFRAHVQGIGAPDPGDDIPEEFYRWDESLVGGQVDSATSTTDATGAGAGDSGT